MSLKFSKKIKIVSVIVLLLSAIFIVFSIIKKDVDSPLITVQEKKAKFNALIVPAVNKVYANLTEQYEDVKKTLEAGKSSDAIEKLKVEYNATTNSELLTALKPHPKSIAIAQAAMESSWATSRFFREANNVFGVWSFNEDESRIAALKKRGDKTIWLRKYRTVEEAVYDYYRTLAKSSAFADFRQAKMVTDNPFILVTKLDRYSEKGSVYGEALTSIIKFNKFDDYDKN
jgi:Bax protein